MLQPLAGEELVTLGIFIMLLAYHQMHQDCIGKGRQALNYPSLTSM